MPVQQTEVELADTDDAKATLCLRWPSFDPGATLSERTPFFLQ